MNSEHGQLPVGLIAQLVEHCTGIAEEMGSNLIQAWIIFRFFFCNSLVVGVVLYMFSCKALFSEQKKKVPVKLHLTLPYAVQHVTH